MDELIFEQKINDLVNDEVAKKNKEFASIETIKQIFNSPKLTIDNGVLTPALEIKNDLPSEMYKEEG
ncbi:MAG: hypothetical protein HKN47_05725 [Pirellulaceae bacterium]|nr:hypothetical protein [Pirellulaceae bacterium]